MTYAGFWRRFAAAIIDSIVLNLLLSPVMGLMMFNMVRFSEDAFTGMTDAQVIAAIAPMMTTLIVASAVGFILQIVYFAYMESSRYQATLGKLALGIVVTDTAGNRISFGRAAGRNIGKVLSGLILMLGYIIAAFTPRKQALHDLLAGTLILEKGTASIPDSRGADSRNGLGNAEEYVSRRYEDDRYDK